jgi:pimeloyl-ACP methyl ester carboxylesterase
MSGLILALVLWTAGPLFGQASQPATRKGVYDTTFDARSPLSAFDIQHDRYGLDRSANDDYDLAKEKFFVNVPDDYDPAAAPPWGLLVWANAGPGNSQTGGVPKDLSDALARNKLICVAAYNVGNDRPVGARIGLALDAAFNMRQRYALDPHRIYIAGVSGGGKVSGMAAMAYPDVFDGAICCAGVNWYLNIPVPEKTHTFWAAIFRKPPMLTFADARDHVGFVLIAGDQDPNHDPAKAAYEQGFVPDGFKHAVFYEPPGLGHRAPPVEWFEKGLAYLDAIPKDRAKKPPATRPIRSTATTANSPMVPSAAERSAAADPSEPARLLSLARTYRSNNMTDKARQKLEQLIRDYPASEEAKLARTMLKELNGSS